MRQIPVDTSAATLMAAKAPQEKVKPSDRRDPAPTARPVRS